MSLPFNPKRAVEQVIGRAGAGSYLVLTVLLSYKPGVYLVSPHVNSIVRRLRLKSTSPSARIFENGLRDCQRDY
jgi:hypothetical protein